eukprot:TRINITY_DN870_c1_g1_i5.p1 TRINITY_DN870_c1_g1~~TRINITY_DN870_c1_g1_i5.p1  ORF type:complete len:810 (-),score=198.83 TRINITY_DN870_c1_g1_i5:26-2380(-)
MRVDLLRSRALLFVACAAALCTTVVLLRCTSPPTCGTGTGTGTANAVPGGQQQQQQLLVRRRGEQLHMLLPPLVVVAAGTRPEVIKLASVVAQLHKRCSEWEGRCEVAVLSTSQQPQMVRAAFTAYGMCTGSDGVECFELPPAVQAGETSAAAASISAHLLDSSARAIRQLRPAAVVVQGDTSTAAQVAQAAFFERVPVIAHVEAGLRTGDMSDPFPEEFNRKEISLVANMHFAPSERAEDALLSEGVPADRIWVTGNTVVDALFARLREPAPGQVAALLDKVTAAAKPSPARLVLVTMHRRESWGERMASMCDAVLQVVERVPDVVVVLPVHTNPAVSTVVRSKLEGKSNRIILVDPLAQDVFPYILNACTLVMTDSGGVQEESLTLGKPVVLMRHATERMEGVLLGSSVLVGHDSIVVSSAAIDILSNQTVYARMSTPHYPYGRGHSGEVIAEVITHDIAPTAEATAFAQACGAPMYTQTVDHCNDGERPSLVDPLSCVKKPHRLHVGISMLVAKSATFLCEMLRSLEVSDVMTDHDVGVFAWVNFPGSEAERAFRAWPTRASLEVLSSGTNEGITLPRIRIYEAMRSHTEYPYDVLVEVHDDMIFPPFWFNELASHLSPPDTPNPVMITYPVIVTDYPVNATRRDLMGYINNFHPRYRLNPATTPITVNPMPTHPWVLDLHALTQACHETYYDPMFHQQHGEDNDLLMRLEGAGCKHAQVHASWVGHRSCSTRLTLAPDVMAKAFENEQLFMSRYNTTTAEMNTAHTAVHFGHCSVSANVC